MQNTTPKIIGDIRKIIGHLRYCRRYRYIKDFSRSAKPIYEPSTVLRESIVESVTFQFQCLMDGGTSNNSRSAIETASILFNTGLSDFKGSFILSTNVSEVGVGPVLYQRENGTLKIISHVSHDESSRGKLAYALW